MKFMGWDIDQLRRCPMPEYLEIVAALEHQAKANG
jgi:hypothetical protein